MKRTSLALAALLLLSSILSGCELGPEGSATPTPVRPATVGEWHYLKPADPDAPALFEATDDADGAERQPLRLKAGWEVDTIEYVDAWWGLGTPGLNNQLIKREGAGYRLGASNVSSDDVQALVTAIDNLYPAQMLMQGHAWTDDYPSWAVEIVGADGQHVLLFASSTGNPGNGPWNVLHNSRLYAQYDGSIAKPLGKLFGGRLGKDDDPFPGSRPQGQVSFSTVGLPPQLTYGFWGLLPISQGFSYTADADKGEIRGQIVGSSRIGSMEIGQIKKLERLEIFTNGGVQLSCKVEALPEGDPWTATTAWGFSCPVKDAKAGARYHYPVTARFGLEGGGTLDISGELWGAWEPEGLRSYILLPPPPEIERAISEHPMAGSLLSDHILGSTRYSAHLTATHPLDGQRNGEAILFGQTEVDGKQVRYTVGAQFVVKDGKLTYWDMDRTGLSEVVGTVVAHPLTRRVLEANPEAVVNMWYAHGHPAKEKPTTLDYGMDAYGTQVNACGSVPGGAFPSAGKPLMAFHYNASPYFPEFGRVSFVMIERQPVVSDLALYPSSLDPIDKALLPAALDTGASRPFERIYMESAPYSGGGPTLHIQTPDDSSAEERAVYKRVLDALPARAEAREDETVVRGVTLAVDAQGKLQVVSCSAQPTATGATAKPRPTDGSSGPKLVYSTYYGSAGEEERNSTSADALAIDSQGNAYITGMTSSSKLPLKDPYDSAHSGSLWDAFVAKLDPNGSSLLYGTYLGSGFETVARGITVDGQGNIYLTGSAREGFRVENSAIQPSVRGDADVFVIKLSADGRKLIYAALLGGADHEIGHQIVADKQGNAYVTGTTESADFHTERPLQAKYAGKRESQRSGDAFVAKISPDGGRLIYSTYLGGSGGDAGYGIAADDDGNAYVAGFTSSQDFPTMRPLQAEFGGDADVFVAKISPDGGRLIYSTFLGGSGDEGAIGIAVDSSGSVYLTGDTASPDFPLVKPLYSTFNGGVSFSGDQDKVRDAFIAKLNSEGAALVFSTFLGGSASDVGSGIGLDARGNIYVGGSTTSPDFPLERPLQEQYAGTEIGLAPDSFIAKLDPSASTLIYSTYFGGEGFDGMLGFAVDSEGNVYLAGSVDAPSPDFPLSGNPFQSTNTGIRSAYIAKISDQTP